MTIFSKNKKDIFDINKNRDKFISTMLNRGYFYWELAWTKLLWISENYEVCWTKIHPSSWDWVVYDERLFSWTYWISHEDYSIYKIKIKKPGDFWIDYSKKALKSSLDTKTLMKRYIWISYVFNDHDFETTPSPYIIFKDEEEVIDSFKKEKKYLKNDPYLALYWILHFRLSFDERLFEVRSIIEKNNVQDKFYFLNMTLDFIDNSDDFLNIEIPKWYWRSQQKLKHIFLKRRAYLVYETHSYMYVSKGYGFLNRRRSIYLYTNPEVNTPIRMRWFWNNLVRYNKWDLFEKKIKDLDISKISLLSYVIWLNPHTKDKTKFADLFVLEIYNNKNLWSSKLQKDFMKTMIWDLRKFFTKDEKFIEVFNFYFDWDSLSQEYKDIESLFWEKDRLFDESREVLSIINDKFSNLSRFETSKEDKWKYKKDLYEIYSSLSPLILFRVIENLKNKVLAKFSFSYLYKNNIPWREKTLKFLFTKLNLHTYEIWDLFEAEILTLIKDKNDPNFSISKDFLEYSLDDFNGKGYSFELSKQVAVSFFLWSLHLDWIFEYIISFISQKDSPENMHAKISIFENLITSNYDLKIDATLKLSKKQVEILLDTIFIYIQSEYFIWVVRYQAITAIYNFSNLLGKSWVLDKLKDKNSKMVYEQWESFVDALENSLEFMEDQERSYELEKKENDITIVYKISFFGLEVIVESWEKASYPEVTSKKFKNIKDAISYSKKLYDQKIKEGYKRILFGYEK